MAGLEGFRLPLEAEKNNRRSLKTTERYDEQHLRESRQWCSAAPVGDEDKERCLWHVRHRRTL